MYNDVCLFLYSIVCSHFMMITKEQDIIIKYVSVKPFVELNECAYVKLHPINKEKRYVVSTEY